jgi:hypothetical protein
VVIKCPLEVRLSARDTFGFGMSTGTVRRDRFTVGIETFENFE